MLEIRRRDLITLIGGAAVAWPLTAHAQQPTIPKIGLLGVGLPEVWRESAPDFQRGLGEVGFVEGRNVALEYRFANDQYDRLPELAAELIRRRVGVIAAPNGTAAALAAKALTRTIPIVFSTSLDPVRSGLVQSLNRPGGNVTGITDMAVDLGSKQLALLHELVPGAARFALLVNPKSPLAEPIITDVQTAASAMGKPIEVLSASNNLEIDAAFVGLAQKRADSLLIGGDVLFNTRVVQLVALAIRHTVPTIYPSRLSLPRPAG
jgi:putative ABC transport system substrate-binding protein